MSDDFVLVSLNTQRGLSKLGKLPKEHIFVYSRLDLVTDSSQRSLQQFNVDFDRQSLFIDHVKCSSRCQFFQKVMPYIDKQSDLDFLLFCCGQTVLADPLISVDRLLTGSGYIMVDGGKPTKIRLSTKMMRDHKHMSLRIKKRMQLVDSLDPDIIINKFDIKVDVPNINGNDIITTVKFHLDLGRGTGLSLIHI